jgi:hypothetical protein
MKSFLLVIGLVSLMTLFAPAAAAAIQDIDYDGLLSAMDELMDGLATLHGIDPSEVIHLYGRDNDVNGIPDEEQFAMLSAVLAGTYTLGGQPYGTNQLDPATVAAIQQGFAANKVRVQQDMTLTGLLCLLLTGAGYSCDLIVLMSSGGNEAVGEAMLALFAGYFTLGEAGFMNYAGSGEDFAETYFDNLIYVSFTDTDFEAYIGQIQSNINFSPNNYYKFGGAANSQPGGIVQANHIGAVGDLDPGLPGLANGAEFAAASGNREDWLNACHVTPPLHIMPPPPRDVDRLSGEAYTWSLGVAGGTAAIGFDPPQVKWSRFKTQEEGTVEVRPFSAEIPYTIPYLLTADDGYRYGAVVQDAIWTRGTLGGTLHVTLDPDFRITVQPQGGVFEAGDAWTLDVAVRGGDALPSYQWYRDGVIVEGAVSETLHFEALSQADEGMYHCEITGDTGLKAPLTLVSDPVLISILPAIEGEGAAEGEGTPDGQPEGVIEGEGAVEGEGVLEGQPEGVIEGEGALEGEGTFEGQPEGVIEGEGTAEGAAEGEGALEGQHEGIFEGEGVVEGQPEGVIEGEGTLEGQPEGTVEGEGVVEGEGALEGQPEGGLEGEGAAEGVEEGEGQPEGEGVVEGEGLLEGEGQFEGIIEGEGEGQFDSVHSGDQNGDGVINLTELLRVIQFFNIRGFHCVTPPAASEDGYLPGTGGDQSCAPHASDYSPQNWQINLTELLRLIQFFNIRGYHACLDQGTEDGYCPGLA